jgi:glycosidase
MAAIRRELPTVRVVGEVLDGDPTMIAFFEGGRVKHDGVDDDVDALFDFPLFYTIRSAFARGGPLRDVAQMLGRDRLYHDPTSMVTLLGLHDVGRFMGEPGATTDGLKLAFTFLLTARGTPLVYYGDEIALPGGNDPDNRRDFPGGWPGDARDAFTAAGRTAEQQDVWAHVQRLARLRAERVDLRRGAPEHLHVGEQTFVYRRGATVVALNNGSAPATIALPPMELPPDALGACAPPTRTASGTTIVIPPRRGCVF